jgi:hypothetical protein
MTERVEGVFGKERGEKKAEGKAFLARKGVKRRQRGTDLQ